MPTDNESGWLRNAFEANRRAMDQLPEWAGGTGREHRAVERFYAHLVRTKRRGLAEKLRGLLGYVPEPKR